MTQLDWIGTPGALDLPPEDVLPDSFFRGFDPPPVEDPPVYLDDAERYGDRPERVDPQTGFLD